ncbi:hypothetical protein [Treponema pectinovorum]|uniref:hypothetical protein n=1 Tax=Treponema pectinovorum TaxID=164 RepID=UPI0011F2C5B1|nr:hypothetical protein [Treponema pectinovorum]
MNKYKRCKRGRDKKTMPAPDFPKINNFVYFSPTRHGKTEKVINISNYYKISDENYNYVLYLGNELLKNCLKVERIKSSFARNIFGSGRNSLKHIPFIERIKLILKANPIDLDEKNLFYLFFDNLHNLPEYIDTLIDFLNGKNVNKYIFSLVENELHDLEKLIDIKNNRYRVGMGIHDTNSIKLWLNELQRMIPYIHKIFLIFKLLIPLMQTQQDMEQEK